MFSSRQNYDVDLLIFFFSEISQKNFCSLEYENVTFTSKKDEAESVHKTNL